MPPVKFARIKFLSAAILFATSSLIFSCHSGGERSGGHTTPGNHPIRLSTEAGSGWALIPFRKVDSVNPVLGPGRGVFTDPLLKKKISWEAKDVFNPAVVVRDGKVYLLYRAQDSIGKPGGTSRIGLAVSGDGFHFTRYPTPVLYPGSDSFKKYEWQGGCEDPRVVEDDRGMYYMTYTAYDGTTARLFVASSEDLIHWKKYGSVFAKAYGGKYANKWSKSGSIVSRYEDGKIIAAKINGRYWMYWGDQDIWAATSTDLINWTPVEMERGEKPPVVLRNQALTMPDLKIILAPRQGYFDNDLVESGPPAMVTDKGILLIYNGRYVPGGADTLMAPGTYSGGQVLLDKNEPTRVISRLDRDFIRPDKPYEISGQVNHVCFLEGLAFFRNCWFLYYGTADSKIAVAVKSS